VQIYAGKGVDLERFTYAYNHKYPDTEKHYCEHYEDDYYSYRQKSGN